jgi:hypothetical protein
MIANIPIVASAPIGTLMKKTHRQFRYSVSNPPRAGPTTGATVTPMPHMVMALICCERAFISYMKDCDIGMRKAPKKPWDSRAATIIGSDAATPHSAELIVKPAMATPNRRFRPNRPASQPVSGVAIAVARI